MAWTVEATKRGFAPHMPRRHVGRHPEVSATTAAAPAGPVPTRAAASSLMLSAHIRTNSRPTGHGRRRVPASGLRAAELASGRLSPGASAQA
jgi:hypothetical protein